MSKQSEAKDSQNYRKQPMCCQCCTHFSMDRVEVKKSWLINPVIEDKNIRCNLGGFSVQKTASCDKFAAKSGS
jgi:hypothetical protein